MTTEDPQYDDPLTKPINYSLLRRRLFVGGLVLAAMVVGWWIMQSQRLRRQRAIVQQLHSQGVVVQFDTEFDGEGREVPAAEQSSGLLALLFGEDPFRRVEGVRLTPEFDHAALPRLRDLEELKQLTVASAANLTEDDWRAIEIAAPQLERIDLRGAALDDVALESLSRFKRLQVAKVDADDEKAVQQRLGDRVQVLVES